MADRDSLLQMKSSIIRAAGIPNAYLLIRGDLNFPSWDWQTMTMKPRAVHTDLHSKFVDIVHDHGLEQMVIELTRRGNILDLILLTLFPDWKSSLVSLTLCMLNSTSQHRRRDKWKDSAIQQGRLGQPEGGRERSGHRSGADEDHSKQRRLYGPASRQQYSVLYNASPRTSRHVPDTANPGLRLTAFDDLSTDGTEDTGYSILYYLILEKFKRGVQR